MRTPLSRRLRYAQTVPNNPNGTDTRKTSRHSTPGPHAASRRARGTRPRPRGDPVDPHCLPRSFREGIGQDRGRVGEQDARRRLERRMMMIHSGSGRPVSMSPTAGSRTCEDGEKKVVHLTRHICRRPVPADHQHPRTSVKPPCNIPQQVRRVGGTRGLSRVPRNRAGRRSADRLVARDH